MKLSPENYKTSWDVHAWAGVIVGLFLAVMFATGAAVVFQSEIQTWQDPSAQRAAPEASADEIVGTVVGEMGSDRPARFRVMLPDGERGLPRIGYFGESGYTEDWVDPEAGALVDKPDKLGTLLYHIHTFYDARFPYAYYLAGVISLVMVLVVVTGFLIQWHNLVDQFHQFRAGERSFVFWNDMHKVLGVTSLPFQLFYAYSAAVIVLGPFFIDAVAGPVFGGDKEAARQASTGSLPAAPEAGAEREPESLEILVETMIDEAKQAVPGFEVDQFTVQNWGKENGVVDFRGGVAGERFSRARVRVGQADGAVMAVSRPDEQSWGTEIRRWMIETHGVAFGGLAVKLMFALLSLAGAVSMVTGLAVWLARRRRQRDALVDRALERLTAGVASATLVGVAAIFVASRLLAWEMPGRWDAEVHTFYWTWLGCVGAAFVVPAVRTYWRVMLGLAGAGFLVVPVLAYDLSAAGLVGLVSGAETLPAVVGVEIGLVIVGLGSLGAAVAIGGGATGSEEGA